MPGACIIKETCENCGGDDATCPKWLFERSEDPGSDTHSVLEVDWRHVRELGDSRNTISDSDGDSDSES